MKKKLIIWGGWWGKNTPLSFDTINSHASVSAYFLTKYLPEFYDIVNIYDFYSAEGILSHKDAIAALSTYQCGFTKLLQRGKSNEFKKIRGDFRGKLCSIVDDAYSLRYSEDIVKPPKVRKMLNGSIVERYGWAAEPELCFPVPVPDNGLNIFVDHSWYRGRLDCSRLYFDVFKKTIRDFPNYTFNVYRQNNDGIVKAEFIL